MRTTFLIVASLAGLMAAAHAQSPAPSPPSPSPPPSDPCTPNHPGEKGTPHNNPFAGPDGLPMDRCYNWGQQCDQYAADQYCRGGFGSQSATSCPWSYKPKTWVLGDNRACTGNCGGFDAITCK
jgi:hypothetical protein